MSLRARLVVQAICVWNALILALLGALFLLFGDRPAGAVVGVACWSAGVALFLVARRVGRPTRWG